MPKRIQGKELGDLVIIHRLQLQRTVHVVGGERDGKKKRGEHEDSDVALSEQRQRGETEEFRPVFCRLRAGRRVGQKPKAGECDGVEKRPDGGREQGGNGEMEKEESWPSPLFQFIEGEPEKRDTDQIEPEEKTLRRHFLICPGRDGEGREHGGEGWDEVGQGHQMGPVTSLENIRQHGQPTAWGGGEEKETDGDPVTVAVETHGRRGWL